MSLVSLVEIRKQLVKEAIRNSLELIQYKLPNKARNIVIKPNLCYYWDYSTGQTTDPRFVAALVDLLREETSHDIDISIVESDASAMKCRYAFKMLGYEDIARSQNVRLINLSEDNVESAEVSVDRQRWHFMVPKAIQDADLRVNVPKIKYLVQTKISCGLKNIFGCNPYPNKSQYHRRLDEAIVALNKLMKFDLCILDGIIVSGSRPRKLGLIMASQDPVALDAAAARIAGINPRSVRHITLAEKEGLGSIAFIPRGTDVKPFEMIYPRKKLTNRVMAYAYTLAIRTGLLKREIV